MSFSFCLNKNELLLLSSFGLLYQGLDLKRKGKLMQDSQRLVCSAIAILERNAALGSAEYKKVACAMIGIDRSPTTAQAVKQNTNAKKKPEFGMEAPRTKGKSGRKQLQAMAARISTGSINTTKKEDTGERRATAPDFSAKACQLTRDSSQISVSSAMSEPARSQKAEQSKMYKQPVAISTLDVPNLDYLSFGDDTHPTPSLSSVGGGNAIKESNMDEFTSCLTTPPSSVPSENIFASSDTLGPYITPSPSTTDFDWGLDLWTLPVETSTKPAAQSVLSFTDSELTSGEEWSIHDGASEYRGITMPNTDGFGLEALDPNF